MPSTIKSEFPLTLLMILIMIIPAIFLVVLISESISSNNASDFCKNNNMSFFYDQGYFCLDQNGMANKIIETQNGFKFFKGVN